MTRVAVWLCGGALWHAEERVAEEDVVEYIVVCSNMQCCCGSYIAVIYRLRNNICNIIFFVAFVVLIVIFFVAP